jgi:hypothetical protein
MAQENPTCSMVATGPRTALLLGRQTSGRRFAGIAWECAEACVVAWHSQGIAGRSLAW